MADDAREERNRDNSASDEGTLSARLRDLGRRIERHHPPESSRQSGRVDSSAIARAWRLSSELVAGVLVGAGIG